ncbi:MAG: c-type cytochrome [Verrucomicrobiales bacterium]|nr:c-type cytochrome [Verrucomicrobiales bacterium]
MDYGPFLTASIEAPAPEGNLAYKGVAIRLGAAFGGVRNEAVVFDTDLLRYSAGWTGDFLALKGVAFDGEHWAYPRIDGRLVFGNPSLPGWARAGSFDDPREHPYGPVPDDWAHWKGLSLHGDRVVLQYSVGDMAVIEMPGLERQGNITAFSRSFNLGPSAVEQVVQIAFEKGSRMELRQAADGSLPVAVLAGAEPVSEATFDPAEGLIGWYGFDDRARPGADGSPGGHTAFPGAVRWTADGQAGGGLEFAGQGWLELPAASRFDFLAGDLTVAAWIKTARDGAVFSKTAPEGPWVRNGKAFFVRGGKLGFDIGWVGAVAGRTPVADDRWHHVAFSYDHGSSEIRLFVDGAVDGESKLKPSGTVTNHVARLGFAARNFPAQPWFRGIMDDVRLYSRVLGEADIASLAGREPASIGRVMAAVVGAPAGCRWLADEEEHLRLGIPAAGNERRFKVLLWRGPEKQIDAFARLATAASAESLGPLTRGGPPRWPERPVTRGELGSTDGPYAIDTLTAPDDNPWKSWLRFGALDFFADSRRAALCTWNGDVWIVDGIDGNLTELTWQRVATGLFQPLGLKIVNDQTYVLGRDQITRLHDLNGDGEADFYENFNNDCMVSEHFHEFATDLKTDSHGNFWYIKCACHAVKATHPHHGTVLKLPPDGSRLEVVARGLRAVNGLGIGPHDEILCVDNQGHWMPGNRINWVQPGGWYGNQFAWNPEGRQSYDEPLCWMHNFVNRSGGTFVWVPDRRWGPLDGNIVQISYGMGDLTLVLPDEVDGVMQGGVTRFPMEFDTGVMRGVFHPVNGQLYTCGLYGWAGNKTKAGGFYRVRYTGKPVNLPRELRVAVDGIVVGFSDPLDPASAVDPGNYSLQAWDYHWTANYGSPDFKLDGTEGRDTWTVESAAVSADGRNVFLKVPELQPVMQFHLVFNLRAADGAPVRNFIHGTVHKLGAEPGADLIGARAVASVRAGQVELDDPRPGLLQTISTFDDPEVPDTRISRLAATFVPRGESPTPWLPGGRFRSVWRGYLRSELNDELRFHLAGAGKAVLRLNGSTVLTAGEGRFDASVDGAVAVRRGLNAFELEYTSPPETDAVIRLSWESSRIPLEPVPATAFVHEGSLPEARQAVAVREGRALFGESLCVRCHRPNEPFPASAMPEVRSEAPAFDGIAARLNAAWLPAYLMDPRAFRSDGRMPQTLPDDPEERLRAAFDIAAFLAQQTGSGPLPDWLPAEPKEVEEGGQLFSELGCVGCHRLAGDPLLPDEARVSLAHVGEKWQPAALPGFLQNPGQYHASTRMPTYALTDAQARSLAAFLLDRAGPVPALRIPLDPTNPTDAPASPDPEKGRELVARRGCLSCHALNGSEPRPLGPSLMDLANGDWRRGCLAESGDSQGAAPDFGFGAPQRDALRAFAEAGGLETLERHTPGEFTARAHGALRCNACHSRDGQPDVWTQVNALSPVASRGDKAEDAGGPAGSVHVGRPTLNFAGEKLHAGWMRRFLSGRLDYKPRSERQGIMPAFPAWGDLLANGLAQEHGYGFERVSRPAADPAAAEIGRHLTLVGEGFGCVSCHDVGGQKALAGEDTATINFAFVADRLLPDYYHRYLQDPQRLVPGTMMPAFIGADGRTPISTPFDGDPDRQFAAVWQYLLSLTPASANEAHAGASVPRPEAAPEVDYE